MFKQLRSSRPPDFQTITLSRQILLLMRQFIFILFAVLTISCNHNKPLALRVVENSITKWSSDTVSDVILSARLIRSYDSIYLYEDSVTRKTHNISIAIVNTSKFRVSFWIMTCSWDEQFLINNDYIRFCPWGCDSNFPILRHLNPNDSLTLKASVYKRERTRHPFILSTKFGFNYIDSTKCKNLDAYDEIMGDLSKWSRIIWSNPLYLRDQ
jgi:hypothetical protein